MGLRITEDVLYYAEDNQWKPLPVIKGKDGEDGQPGAQGVSGDDAYTVWAKYKGYEDDPQEEHWQEYLQEHSRVPVPGASRVVKEGTKYYAYTPKKVNASDPEPPGLDTDFVPWDPSNTNSYDKIELPSGGGGSTASNINYKSLTSNADYPISFLPNTTASSGGLVSEIGYISNVKSLTFNPYGHGLCIGNKGGSVSTVSSKIYLSSYRGNQGGTKYGINYNNPNRVVGVAHLSDDIENNIEFGGASDDSCALGHTYIRAGAASFTNNLVNQADGKTTANQPNAVMIRRKVGDQKKVGGSWSSFKNVDSGHIECVRVKVNLAAKKETAFGTLYRMGNQGEALSPETAANYPTTWQDNNGSTTPSSSTERRDIWTTTINLKNKYTVTPCVVYSIVEDVNMYQTPFEDHWSISNVRVINNQLKFNLACKQKLSLKSAYQPGPLYINFMIMTMNYQ